MRTGHLVRWCADSLDREHFASMLNQCKEGFMTVWRWPEGFRLNASVNFSRIAVDNRSESIGSSQKLVTFRPFNLLDSY